MNTNHTPIEQFHIDRKRSVANSFHQPPSIVIDSKFLPEIEEEYNVFSPTNLTMFVEDVQNTYDDQVRKATTPEQVAQLQADKQIQLDSVTSLRPIHITEEGGEKLPTLVFIGKK